MKVTIGQINNDLKDAMRAKDEVKLLVLRMLVSAIKNKQIEEKTRDQEASEELIIKVTKSEIKKRKDAAETYKQGERNDLAEKEEAEIKILEEYMPEQMSEADIKKIIEAVIAEAGENPNFGQIMGQTIAKTKGQADGTIVSRIVKELLG